MRGILHVGGCDGCGRCAQMLLRRHHQAGCGLYEEGLDQKTLQKAVMYIRQAEVLIIGGTSLTVYPAAGLIDYYQGNRLVLINKSVTPMDSRADLVISGKIGEVLGQV